MKKYIVSITLLLCLFFVSSCHSNTEKNTTKSSTNQSSSPLETDSKGSTPTLFIHGYSGTINSFGGMIDRFEKQQLARKELVITVQPDSTLQIDGKLSNARNNPMIQVLFADNKNNEWNQSEWIYAVLRYLKTQNVEQVNILGHSMGGVSSLRFLTTYGEPEDSPKIVKLVAIGSPFNDFIDTSNQQTIDELLVNGPTQKSDRYIDYENGIANVPTSLPMLLLAGELGAGTSDDGTVPLTSALSVYSLVEKNGNPIRQSVFVGPNAQHSQLHENKAVDQQVAQFLWEEKP
ncbi:alpha/beta hydrolase [Candidatus Enterococcus ferrettii]|uniref:Alpha/beta hydrolase n=1 Tax=Candidatus Enterococcus ferrettii TaxID=2815324 RepID=A0ABV0EWR7_9ENTE|nr:alpha/beta hydrolase [Enterococcus sp. 665A]MBO1338812.1 alpha/beta hydrolase [Enterococcus sp. 665A]